MPKTRTNACQGKRRHSTRERAEEHRWRLIRQGSRASLLRAYRCRFCGCWHVGHLRFGKR